MALSLYAPGAAVVAAGALAAGGDRVLVVIDCLHTRYKPAKIVFACGHSESAQRLAWSKWTLTSAAATGTDVVNDCRPGCATGHIHSYPVRVELSRPKHCAGQRHKLFSRATLTFTGRRPGGVPTTRWVLNCPAML